MTEREAEYAADAARNAWYDTAGEYPRRFEHGMAEYVGVRHAVSLPHCTAGIHLSLVALEVGRGDEVIVPDATWIASAAPITYVGATTVFADVDPDTWCLAVDAFKSCITPRTKAVIPVHLYGGVADMDAIRAVAEHHRIAIIEDAAEAVGSELHGHKAGSMGDTGVFSFHGSKTLATGEGGMVVTNSDELLERILFLRDHGRVPGDRHFSTPICPTLGDAEMGDEVHRHDSSGRSFERQRRRAFRIYTSQIHAYMPYTPDGVAVFYQISVPYEPASAAGVRWDDPAFNTDWPVDQPFLSERDAAFPDFQP